MSKTKWLKDATHAEVQFKVRHLMVSWVTGSLPVWIGAGSPESVSRAATLGYPVAIPVLGGTLTNYAQLAASYRNTWIESGHSEKDFKLATFSHLHIAEDSQKAYSEFYPYYSAYLEPLFKGPMPRDQYQAMYSSNGSLFAGSPHEVIDKIMFLKEKINITRYVGQIDIGGQSFSDVVKGIEFFASKVAPCKGLSNDSYLGFRTVLTPK